jgi:dTMP kinase
MFITFEGGEGCGKSVQAKILFNRLCSSSIPTILTHEPGGTPLGDEICQLLKWNNKLSITPLTELLLFNASRSQLVDRVIKPNLSEGKVVICDRFIDSTIVYQGYGRGLNMDLLREITDSATQGLHPDLTILLDLSITAGLKRKNNTRQDRFENEDIAFHEKVRRGYLTLAAEEPQRWLVIDANQSKEAISEIIWRQVFQTFNKGI